MSRQSKARPSIASISNLDTKTALEAYQNIVLRPIIKMQHKILLAHFEATIKTLKLDLSELNKEKRTRAIRGLFLNNHRFKAEMKGIILGCMDVDEYQTYLLHASEYNKRIFDMLCQRVESFCV